jgi:hypothetical protein
MGRPLWREDGSVSCICCWLCQRSLSWFRVPLDSWLYFTVSDLRLLFWLKVKVKVILRSTVSLTWNKAPIWSLRPNSYYCQTVAGLLMWGALSDERTGLSLVNATGTRQRSHSWIRAPLVSWSYLTVSYVRFPFSSPPTTCRVMVEVFDLAWFKVNWTYTSGNKEINTPRA